MSYIALVIADLEIGVDIIKKMHLISGRSFVEIKKSIKNGSYQAVINTLKSTEREDVDIFLGLMSLCDKNAISYQLYRKDEVVENNENLHLSASLITRGEFDKILKRNRFIEESSQKQIDLEVED